MQINKNTSTRGPLVSGAASDDFEWLIPLIHQGAKVNLEYLKNESFRVTQHDENMVRTHRTHYSPHRLPKWIASIL